MKRVLPALLLGAAAGAALAEKAPYGKVAFPAQYRGWEHVKTMVINQGHPLHGMVGGMHHIYANPKAMQAYKGKHKFADGAVIVFDLFEAVEGNFAVVEGNRKAVIVMQKDARKFKATGGWGYQVFDPASRKGLLDARGAADCHGCHAQAAAQGFVFSAYRK